MILFLIKIRKQQREERIHLLFKSRKQGEVKNKNLCKSREQESRRVTMMMIHNLLKNRKQEDRKILNRFKNRKQEEMKIMTRILNLFKNRKHEDRKILNMFRSKRQEGIKVKLMNPINGFKKKNLRLTRIINRHQKSEFRKKELWCQNSKFLSKKPNRFTKKKMIIKNSNRILTMR